MSIIKGITPVQGGGGGAPAAFDPLTLPGLQGWFDPSAGEGTGYRLDGSSNVDILYDLSPGSNNAVEVTPGDNPSILDVGGMDYLDFSGNKILDLPSNWCLTAGSNVQPFFFAAVVRKTSAWTTFNEILCFGSSGSRLIWLVQAGGLFQCWSGFSSASRTGIPADGTPVVMWAWQTTAGDKILGYNDTLDRSDSPGTGAIGGGDTGRRMGSDLAAATHFFNAQAGEQFYCAGSDLSVEEVSAAVAYLVAKWIP